ncbi:MAG: hypothetical protein ACYCTI_01770 [Acidimicrobiales bacterium]
MTGTFSAAAGSFVLLAVALLVGFPFEIVLLVVLAARLARMEEASRV